MDVPRIEARSSLKNRLRRARSPLKGSKKSLKSRILSGLSPGAQAKQLAPVPSRLLPHAGWVVLFPRCLLLASQQVAVLGFDLLLLGLLKSIRGCGAPASVWGQRRSKSSQQHRKYYSIYYFFKTILMKNNFFISFALEKNP